MQDNLSEDDSSVKFITPAIVKAGWGEAAQIRRQVSFIKGCIIVRGKLLSRGKAKKADFALYWQHCRAPSRGSSLSALINSA